VAEAPYARPGLKLETVEEEVELRHKDLLLFPNGELRRARHERTSSQGAAGRLRWHLSP
jgi:hypothetical protein